MRGTFDAHAHSEPGSILIPAVEQHGEHVTVHETSRAVKACSKDRLGLRNIKQPESVSDHMYRMAMMALTLQDPSVNRERCMKLALVHDLAECIVGDIAPADNISKAEKHRREKEAMVHITGLLDEDLRKEMYRLWEEYETQSSPEARVVKELDQLEMILQAHEYEELEGNPGRLQEFFNSTEGRFHHPEVLALVKSLNEERARHMTKAGETGSEKSEVNRHPTATDTS